MYWNAMLGVLFVSEDLPNHEELEDQLSDLCKNLMSEATGKLDAWLLERGLECVNGVVVKLGSVK